MPAEAICFRVFRPCHRPCVHPCVLDSCGSFMFPRYLQYLLTDFGQTFVTGASRDRDELIRFWGQRVKVQGHSMTECIPDFHVSTISPVSIYRFSPNFCHWCISGHRWTVYVFESKGQRSRSHHRGGGAHHSTLPSSATFSSYQSEILMVEIELVVIGSDLCLWCYHCKCLWNVPAWLMYGSWNVCDKLLKQRPCRSSWNE